METKTLSGWRLMVRLLSPLVIAELVTLGCNQLFGRAGLLALAWCAIGALAMHLSWILYGYRHLTPYQQARVIAEAGCSSDHAVEPSSIAQ